MEIFRSMTQTVLGNNQPDNTPSGADTVEKVVERVVSSSLLEDRRDGCRALRALAPKYRVLVGAHAMDALLQALEADRSDHELVNYILETLITITSPEPFDEEIEETGDEQACRGLGEQFTEIVTKKTDNIALFLGLLDEFDFKVRYPIIRLFSNLLENRARGVQEAVLEVPSGVSKLMDLLSDSREVIRNHMLLLLAHLTRGNATLQKILVFENIFDNLFAIMREEGYSDGGVVVEDCLELLLTLLRTSPPNQTLLREGGYVTHLTCFFTTLLDEGEERGAGAIWQLQKIANVHKMLELVCALVQPISCQSEVSVCQSLLRSTGLLASLCRMLLATGVPAATSTLTITTLADVIRANADSQKFFSNVMAPSVPPRPAVLVLLMSLVNEKQSVQLRCAVLYCLHCLLCRNQGLQADLVATLLPQTSQAQEMSSGQLLCGGLFSADPTSQWLCAVALTHALHDNTDQKDQLLRVQLSPGTGGQCVSLLQQCCTVLHSSTSFLARVGLLQLLSLWLLQCPRAVTQLLCIQSVMPHLTAQISSSESEDQESQIVQGLCAFVVGLCALYNETAPGTMTRAQLASLVTDRIGAHVFRNKLSGLARTDLFATVAKSPKLAAINKQQLCFDHSFVSSFRTLEGSLLRAVNIGEAGAGELLEQKISELQAELSAAQQQTGDLRAEKQALGDTVQQLTQQQQALQHQHQDLQQQQQQTLQQCQALQQQQQQTLQQYQVLQQQQQAVQDKAADGSPGDSATLVPALQQQVAELTYARDYYYYQMLEKDKLMQQQKEDFEQQKVQLEQQKPLEHKQDNTNNAVSATNGVPATNGIACAPDAPDLITDAAPAAANGVVDTELETLRCQLQDLQLVLQKKDETLYHLQQKQLLQQPSAKEDDGSSQQVGELQSRLLATEQSRSQLTETNRVLQLQLQQSQSQLQQSQSQLQQSQSQLQDLQSQPKELKSQRRQEADSSLANSVGSKESTLEQELLRRKQLESELAAVQSEQEDLLLLLSEQDGRLQRYRSHLTVRGVSPPPGEEEEEDEEEEDDDGSLQ